MQNFKSEGQIEYLKVPEIANRLRVTRQAIYQRVRRGDFGTVVRIGSAMRIPKEDFERWLEEHTTKAKRWPKENQEDPAATPDLGGRAKTR